MIWSVRWRSLRFRCWEAFLSRVEGGFGPQLPARGQDADGDSDSPSGVDAELEVIDAVLGDGRCLPGGSGHRSGQVDRRVGVEQPFGVGADRVAGEA